MGIDYRDQETALLEYIRSIGEDDKVAILLDGDEDGQTSTKLMKEILTRSGRKVELVRTLNHRDPEPPSEILEELVQKGITHTITLDLPIGEKRAYWEELAEKSKLAIIDHHRAGSEAEGGEEAVEDLMRREDIVYVNPHFMKEGSLYEGDPSRWNTSKLVWDLTNAGHDINHVSDDQIDGGIDDLDWVCAMGVIADYAFRKWNGFLGSVAKRHGYEHKITEVFNPQEDIYAKGIGRIVKLLGLVNKDEDPQAVEKVYRLLDTAQGPEEFTAMLLASGSVEEREAEVAELLPRIETQADCSRLRYLFIPDENTDLRGSLSGVDAANNQRCYVLVACKDREKPGRVKLSLRCEAIGFEPELMGAQQRSDHERIIKRYRTCDEILEAVAGKYDGGGGGHIAAAGGKVPEANYEAFLEDFKREINEMDLN